jgi:hypothetical protein
MIGFFRHWLVEVTQIGVATLVVYLVHKWQARR